MVRREESPEFVNRIANDADVRPFIRPDGAEIDLSELVQYRPAQSGVIFLSNGEDALGIFSVTAPDIFQSHTLFGPTCRGRKAIETAKEMLEWMFERGAKILWGTTPRDNRKARWFNRQIGAKVLWGDERDEVFEIRRAI